MIVHTMTSQNTIQPTCIVCSEKQWLALPIPLMRSVRSDGAILNQPLSKAQCGACGMVQSVQLPDTDALTFLYTENYDIYNNRPASEQFVASRYTALAKAITESVSPYQPTHVLEVGCGNGAALHAVQSLWPEANCIGVEPVTTAVEEAKLHGFNVHQGMIGVDIPEFISKQHYDVIYTVHVIEHTQNPISFLTDLKKMLTPHGRLIISCPNACVPNLEIMRTDHNYSMTPYHLDILARKAGLVPVKNTLCPGGAENLDYEHNQLLVCRLPENSEHIVFSPPLPDYLNESNRKQLFDARKKYFLDFGKLDEILQSALQNVKRLFCFGTGGWACMLAGYAPRVWEKVEACVIDSGSDQLFHGKPIHSYATLKEWNPDAVIIGTNPGIQGALAERIEKNGFNVIRWDSIIKM